MAPKKASRARGSASASGAAAGNGKRGPAKGTPPWQPLEIAVSPRPAPRVPGQPPGSRATRTPQLNPAICPPWRVWQAACKAGIAANQSQQNSTVPYRKRYAADQYAKILEYLHKESAQFSQGSFKVEFKAPKTFPAWSIECSKQRALESPDSVYKRYQLTETFCQNVLTPLWKRISPNGLPSGKQAYPSRTEVEEV